MTATKKRKRQFYPENIPTAVDKFRETQGIPRSCSYTLEKPISGGQCQIFQLSFSVGVKWSVRCPVHMKCSEEAIIDVLRNEISVLQELETSGFEWSPKVIGFDLTFDNPTGLPFIVLSWIACSKLAWNDCIPSRYQRDKVLSQLANILIALISCTAKKSSGNTSLIYLTNIVDKKTARVRSGHLPGIRVEDCLDLRDLLGDVVHGELNNAPFFIGHGDLSPENIIVDSDFNITGLVAPLALIWIWLTKFQDC